MKQIKAGLLAVGTEEGAVVRAADWISASLCDGEDEKSEALDKGKFTYEIRTRDHS